MADIGPQEGPIIALRADLDGLPVQDTTADPWRSTLPGVAHACGHDVHTAGLVGAAVALARLHELETLPVGVRLIFQPAEEVMPGGALKLLAGGVLKGVSRIFALHCDPTLDVGHVGLREGPITGASDRIHVTLAGRGGHTSRPHLTEDLTYAMGALVTQLPAVLSRRFDPRAGASMVWGHLRAGNAANVIPAQGELSGTLRMLDASAWHSAEHLVRGLIADILEPFGVSAGVTYIRGVPPVVNDFAATELLRRAVGEAVGPGRRRHHHPEPRRRGLRLVRRVGARRDGSSRHPHARRRHLRPPPGQLPRRRALHRRRLLGIGARRHRLATGRLTGFRHRTASPWHAQPPRTLTRCARSVR